MKLWDDELEGHREEARALLAAIPTVEDTARDASPLERARAQRESFRKLAPPALLPNRTWRPTSFSNCELGA